jgi:heme/copper-type cytochrome/quinol oxidase subunit 4
MNLLWLYQIHTFWLGILIVGFFVAASVLGLRLTRPLARRFCREQNDFANYFFATVAVFYAVLVGLIAVACWGNYTTIDGIVSNEAVSSSDVYRDIESYPLPLRDQVRGDLRAYVKFVIEREWPAQTQGGRLPRGGDVLMQQIAQRLTRFEPATSGQQAVHIQTLHDLDDLFSNRRLRFEAIDSHLPGLMWLVVLAGAAIMIFMTYFFCSESETLHLLLTAALSVVIGLVIFLILSLDRPLAGYVSIDASSFEDALTTMGGAATP